MEVQKMKEVIYIDNKPLEKPVEITHYFDSAVGWVKCSDILKSYNKIVYLGKCDTDGDMFVAYEKDFIDILKGHLNSGKY